MSPQATPTPTNAVAVRGPLAPLDLEQTRASMQLYQEGLRALLDESDWQVFHDKDGAERKFVKKSGFRKIATWFELNLEVTKIEIDRDQNGNPRRARAIARAVAPNGRYADGDGAASLGERTFSKPENDLPAQATTRAMNRAISNLVGMGAVCLPERTEILTRWGWRRHDQIAIGDEVLTYDRISDRCSWGPLRAIHVYDDEPVMRLQSRGFSVVCTAAHRWVVERKSWRNTRQRVQPPREMRRADDLKRGEPKIVLAAPAESGDHPLSPRDSAVLGWIITDGLLYWTQEGARQRFPRAVISQSKQPYVDEIRELLGDDCRREEVIAAHEQAIKGTVYAIRQSHRFHLDTAYLRRLIADTGVEHYEDVPALVTRLDAESRQTMLDAMLKADGTRKPSGAWMFTKVNRAVRDTFQLLCTLEGVALGTEMPAKDSRAVDQGQRFSRYVDGSKLRCTPEFPERVWCPTTDYGTWVARLDGQVFITGNSAEEVDGTTFTTPAAAASPEGEPADEKLVNEAIQAVQQVKPEVDAPEFIRVLGNSYRSGFLPASAANALKGLAFWVGRERAANTPPATPADAEVVQPTDVQE
jgi:hypothetical protein